MNNIVFWFIIFIILKTYHLPGVCQQSQFLCFRFGISLVLFPRQSIVYDHKELTTIAHKIIICSLSLCLPVKGPYTLMPHPIT